MKNFDFPYINDSPVDLSGREGAEMNNTELEIVVLDRVLTELESRGVLVDEWKEVFGCKSFDEVIK